MSDTENDEIDLSEESDLDFSTSEDEWIPEKNHKKSSDEDEETDTDDLAAPANTIKSGNKYRKPNTIQKLAPPVLAKLQGRLYNKCKTKTDASNSKNIIAASDDSDSSGDDCLVDSGAIDLKSKFFDIVPTKSSQETVPEFDCNIGLKLSDSDNESDNVEPSPTSIRNEKIIDFSKHQQYIQHLESAKTHLINFKSTSCNDSATTDVGSLLALGEISSKSSERPSKQKRTNVDSDSDWEEVEEKTVAKGVQFTVGHSDIPKKVCRETDAEAKLRRQINQRKRELQLLMHKVHILCWIGHGNIVNATLNNFHLTKMCLAKFIPSPQCYPKERTDITYFEQISKWYKTQMALKDQRALPKLKKLPPLSTSLALQIDRKQAICKRDFVLIFIILLRSIGIQCRMIINLPVVPIKPPQKDLCLAANDQTVEHTKKTKSKTKSTSNDLDAKPSTSATLKEKLIVTKAKIDSKKITSPTKSRESYTTTDVKKSSDTSPRKITDETQNKSNTKRKAKKSENTDTTPTKQSKAFPVKPVTVAAKDGVMGSPKFTKQLAKFNTPEPSTSRQAMANLKEDGKKKSASLANNICDSPISRRTRKRVATKSLLKPPQLDGAPSDSKPTSKRTKPNLKRLQEKSAPKSTDDEDGIDFKPSPPKKIKHSAVSKLKRIDRRVLSTDNEDEPCDGGAGVKKTVAMDFWIEVYCESDQKWIPINLFKLKFDCIDEIRKTSTKPIGYVLAWNSNNTIKDVSARYCPQWNTLRKTRVEQCWLDTALSGFIDCTKSETNLREDRELNRIHLEEPVPKSITELKNHPLYVLERHLLKFEAIYPANALTVGFIKSEAIYLRDCVYTLHSRELWVKQARVVKPGEEPYKIVKARPKWDRILNKMLEAQPLEIFGYWQTQPYEPPTAENGIVPRNAYGNVELFKPEMLPKKTVHLQLASLNRTCKRMGIDCAQAVVGFDFHSGSSHPTFDGFVICEEFAEKVVEQWFEDQQEAERKEEEKYKQRVYGNWKKLIKGLWIRERLQRKYKFKDESKKGRNENSGKS